MFKTTRYQLARCASWAAVICLASGCQKIEPLPEIKLELQPVAAEPSCPIAGLWIRENDSLANTVMSIAKNSQGEISGTLLYVSEGAMSHGFQFQDLKIRDIQATSGSKLDYEGESLCRGVDFTEWSEVTLRLASDDRLITRDKVAVDRPVGSRQEWRRIQPKSPEMGYVYYGNGMLELDYGDLKKASECFRLACKYRPENAFYCNDLAWKLATSKHEEIRNPQDAIELASYACDETSYRDPQYLDTLAAAYAADGEFTKAVEYQEKAVQQVLPFAKRKFKEEFDALHPAEQFGVSFGLGMMSEDEVVEYYLGEPPSNYRKRLRLYKSKKPYFQ